MSDKNEYTGGIGAALSTMRARETVERILICSNHRDEIEVPLIWTFMNPGCEYWCPFCGFAGGMLGSGDRVEETPELKARLQAYQKFSEEYRHASACRVASQVKHNDEWIDPDDLPDEIKKKNAQVIADWKYRVVLEGTKTASPEETP